MPPFPERQDDRPFGPHDYEIVFGRLERAREVHVRAASARPLAVGEIFTLDRPEGLYDVVVAEMTTLTQGGWSARCRVIDIHPG